MVPGQGTAMLLRQAMAGDHGQHFYPR